jgi:hypothetical protein
MTYQLNKAQFDNVLKLPGPARYNHFIARIADWRQVWMLKQSAGIVTFEDDEGNICVPFWPHADYAKALAVDDWATCVPVDIPLDSFKEKWLPGMAKDDYLVAVFPTPNQKGVVVPPERLSEDLNEKLAKIE